MSTLQKFAKNTLSWAVAWSVQPIINFIWIVVVTRALDKDLFGQYTIIFQFYYIFEITSSLGLKFLLTREVAVHRNLTGKYLKNGALLAIPSAIINMLILVAAVKIIGYDGIVEQGLYIISFALIGTSLTDIYSAISSGIEEVRKTAYSWIIFLLINTAASVALLSLGYGVIALTVSFVVAKFIHALISYLYIPKDIPKEDARIDFQLWKSLMRETWSLALLNINISLFWRIDTVLLSTMVSDDQVGTYGAAFRIFWFTLFTVRGFIIAFFPMVSSMFLYENEKFQIACRKAMRYLTIIILPVVLVLCFYSPDVILMVFGKKYFDSIIVFQVMIWALLPYAITETFSTALVAGNKQNQQVLLSTVNVIVKTVACYFLILEYGIMGPAIATIIALLVSGVMQKIVVVPKLIDIHLKSIISPGLKALGAGLLMLVSIYFMRNFNLVLGAILSLLIYFVSLLAFKIFSEDDKYYFRKVMKKTS